MDAPDDLIASVDVERIRAIQPYAEIHFDEIRAIFADAGASLAVFGALFVPAAEARRSLEQTARCLRETAATAVLRTADGRAKREHLCTLVAETYAKVGGDWRAAPEGSV